MRFLTLCELQIAAINYEDAKFAFHVYALSTQFDVDYFGLPKAGE